MIHFVISFNITIRTGIVGTGTGAASRYSSVPGSAIDWVDVRTRPKFRRIPVYVLPHKKVRKIEKKVFDQLTLFFIYTGVIFHIHRGYFSYTQGAHCVFYKFVPWLKPQMPN
jgi:hypothetical protein